MGREKRSGLGGERASCSFGWDFENVWMICEGRDYPRLRWEGVRCEE